MIDQVKNNINNLSSSGSNKSSSETKKANVEVKQINQSSTKTKLDSGEVSKFVTKERIKDMAKEPIDQAATTRIKNAIANGSYPIDLDKIADALFDAYKEMKE
jgi:negative regulator of flagellin synthesis FlgM